MAKRSVKGEGICHYCGAPLLDFPGTYTAIDPNDCPVPSHPIVGWLICSPGCPERPDSAIVEARGATR